MCSTTKQMSNLLQGTLRKFEWTGASGTDKKIAKAFAQQKHAQLGFDSQCILGTLKRVTAI